jgi:thioredoxin reductase (NADPH)
VHRIEGENSVSSIIIEDIQKKEEKTLAVDGIFIAVGIEPNSTEFKGLVEMDGGGYIVAGEEGHTSVPGIFAAGDVRTKALRQIVTAAADGANAVFSAEKYLIEKR